MAKGGEITYTAESYYKNKLGVWEDSIAYEYSEYFADELEDLIWLCNELGTEVELTMTILGFLGSKIYIRSLEEPML